MTSVPGLSTVSWVELAWLGPALVACLFSYRAKRMWARVDRGLAGDANRGARSIAHMIRWFCRFLLGAAVFEALIDVPPLMTPPNPDASLAAMVVATGVAFAFSGAIVAMAVYLYRQTSQLGHRAYTGPERRGPPAPAYDGPRRRGADRPAPATTAPPDVDPASHLR